MAIAKGRSELRCWQKTAQPDGSVNRGQSCGVNWESMLAAADGL